MKILYAIQGTGNGHIMRAMDIIPILQKKGEVDILLSGTQSTIVPPFGIKYRLKGLSFVFGKNGGIDLLKTITKGNLRRLLKEIHQLPIEDYDVVISDFEPVAAWACKLKHKSCIALSHQSAVMHYSAPKPGYHDIVGRMILKNYAPASHSFGFHFKSYDNGIFTPIIRKQIRSIIPSNLEHYTVYLPAYEDKRIYRILGGQFKTIRWQVFTKHCKQAYSVNNVSFFPIENDAFVHSMATAAGVLCGAGFETPAEALYLKKKLLVIPMKNQYEQHCNAAALEELGVPVMKRFKQKYSDVLRDWLLSDARIKVVYPDITAKIIGEVLNV